MKEKLIDIVNNINSYLGAKKGTGISSIARVHCVRDGREDTYWFTSNESFVRLQYAKQLDRFGHFVSKNSNVAIKMQMNEMGSSFEYDQMDNIRRMRTHRIVLENRTDFQNQTIAIAGDNILYQYRGIGEFLNALKQNREDIIEVEAKILELKQNIEELKSKKDTAHQRGQITKTIKSLQEEYRILTQQQEDLKNITIYIRKQGEMRYSLIVDTIQTRIKSQNIFDGKTIIINGGPGTGKTTTMIHRLAYLTDLLAIDEDEKNQTNNFKLNTLQRQHLRDAIKSQRDWLFFSPSSMLREYLAVAMQKEGLENTSQKVWNWKDYCRFILEVNYHLLESSAGKAPFKICHQSDTLYYQQSFVINELINFYLDELRQIKVQLPVLNQGENVFKWTTIANNIAKRFEVSENYNISQFIQLFNSLESVYGNDCKELLRDNKAEINAFTSEIINMLEKNKSVKSDLIDILELTTNETDNTADEGESSETEQNDYLTRELQKWLKAYCYNIVNSQKELSDEQHIISDIILPMLGNEYDSKLKKIGELVIFEQIAKYTRGVKAIMLNGIPDLFKRFRTHLINSKFEHCNLKLLRDIKQSKQGRELHYQEQSLLLGFINNIVKQIKASGYTNIKHNYIDAYDEVARPIIGIDEATDFCDCDIYAMQSLLTRDFSSLTLCGDMMQRMTSYGIKSWSELDNVVPNPTVVEMKTSYRQSKKLLEVARQIYKDTIGETPSYKAFMKSNKVPSPLVFVDNNEFSRIQWISKRLEEVYRAYGQQLPSIAIFVNDKGYIPRFIENLKNTDFFNTSGIEIFDGTDDKSKTQDSHICVYPIEVVKGMEFDVVFFHNLDNSSVDTELLKRYIYVGVSRAAFFLAVTLSEKNPEVCRYFEENKDWFKI